MRRSTLVLVVAFLALLGVVYYLQNKPLKAEPLPTGAATITPQPPMVFDVSDSSLIQTLRVEDASGNYVVFQRDSTGTWMMTEPVPDMIDAALVDEAAVQMAGTRALTSINPQLGLDAIGLTKPVNIVTIVLVDGTRQVLQVGNLTPTGSGYYVRQANGTVAVAGKYNMMPVLDLLVTPPIVTPTAEGNALESTPAP